MSVRIDRKAAIRRFRGAGAIAVLSAIAPVLAVLVWIAICTVELPSEADSTKAVVTQLRIVPYTTQVDVKLVPAWRDGTEVLFMGSTGIVTSVSATSGGTVATGDELFHAGNQSVRAYVSDQPLAAPVDGRSADHDQATVRNLLASVGWLSSDRDWETRRSAALRCYTKVSGIDVPRPTAFEPGWAVWVPPYATAIDEVVVRAGTLPPSSGDVVFHSRKTLESVDVVSDASEIPDGVITMGSLSFAVQNSSIDLTELSQLEPFLDPKSESAPAVLVTGEEVDAIAVPPGAVIADTDGRLCYFVRRVDSAASEFHSVIADVIGGTVGTTYLANSGDTGDEVLLNPRDILAGADCA